MTYRTRAITHFRFGWIALTIFLLAGITLEAMHGFKVAWYLDVGEETRRLMWRLGHAHGTMLALVQLGFAATLSHLAIAANDEQPRGEAGSESERDTRTSSSPRWLRIASPCLRSATIAIPAGFFLGGVTTYGGDPGPGIFVLPIGAVLLVVGVVATALGVLRTSASRSEL